MRVLVLDDDEILRRKPADYFVDAHDYTQDEFVQTKDKYRFFELLYFQGPWDEVWFDNDLGTQEFDGMRISKDILEMFVMDKWCPDVQQFVVTTANNVAQSRIADNLRQTTISVVESPIWMMGDKGICRGNRFIEEEVL